MNKKSKYIFLFLVIFTASCATWGTNPIKRKAEQKVETFNLTGDVLWEGKTPLIYPIPTTAYSGACGERRSDSELRLKPTRLWYKRLLDVVVWLEPVWQDMTPEEIKTLTKYRKHPFVPPVQIEEIGCEFKPRLTVIPVGTVVEILNEDRKDHWLVIQGLHKDRAQFVQRYGETPSVFTFETPGVHVKPADKPLVFVTNKVDTWHLTSGFHRWMEAWVVVTDKTWYDKVDRNGHFAIKDVPRGTYNIRTWHPVLGETSTLIKVPDDIRGRIFLKYSKVPQTDEEIGSTVITTSGEVSSEHSVWHDFDEW